MRDCTRIGAAYEAMHCQSIKSDRAPAVRVTIAALCCAATLFMASHLFGDLGARVSDDIARGAAEYCGRC